MTSYAILAQPGAQVPDPESEIIGDRFAWWGLIFGGLWLLWHRAWLAGVAVVAAKLIVGWLSMAAGFTGFGILVDLAIALLVGLEGNHWRLEARLRRGMQLVDLVEAANPDLAFEIHARRRLDGTAGPSAPPPLPERMRQAPRAGSAPELFGLIPHGRET